MMGKSGTASVKELRGFSAADLTGQLAKLREELWQQRVKIQEGAQQQTHRRSALRRQIARVLTVLNEQPSAAKPAAAPAAARSRQAE